MINGGALQYTGALPASTNRLFTIGAGGNATLDASGGGALTVGSGGGAIAFANSSSPASLTLIGSGVGVLSAVVGDSNPGVNSTSLIKAGSGDRSLNAANTFTGGTSVNGGTLNLNGSNMTDSIAVSAGALLGGTGSAASAVATVTTAAPLRPAPAASAALLWAA